MIGTLLNTVIVTLLVVLVIWPASLAILRARQERVARSLGPYAVGRSTKRRQSPF